MISANELRIGNYIQSGTGIYNVISISHYKDSTDIITVSNDGVVIPYPCFYKGIKITKEWLLKFGFIYSNCGNNDYLTFLCPESLYYLQTDVRNDSNKFSILYRSDNDLIDFSIELLYVHELQNIYFSLTKNELI